MARISLTRSIKFRRLVRVLGIPEPHVRGHLDYMWESCWESVSPTLGTPEVVELVAMWNGAPGVFAQALEDIGFLDRDEDNNLQVHDFWEHAPDYVDRRLARAKKKQEELYNRGRTTPSRTDERRQAAESTASRPAPPRPEKHDLYPNVVGNQHLPAEPTANRSTGNHEPRKHKNPPAEIDVLIDYSTQVLNKLEGVTTETEREDRGTLLAIATRVPGSLIRKALADTQDAKQNATLRDAGKYFTSRINALCVASNIRGPFAQDVKRAREPTPQAVHA